MALEKLGPAHIENLTNVHTHIESEEIANLPQEHRDYLLQRHGTLQLDPVPDMSDADPYNWPHSKKIINLSLVAFHAMMATFTASAIQSAFEDIAVDLSVSLTKASYLTSLVIAILGVSPLVWRPLSDRYGRRPVFMVSLLCSLVGNIGCALSPTYATMAFCRAITAFFISPAAAIGSAVVAECFFKKDRGMYMGVWTLLASLGVPLAPFVFGFVALRVGYRWIYYILAITHAVQFILYTFFGPETRYLRSGVQHKGSNLRQKFFSFRRINPKPLSFYDFVQPLIFTTRPVVLITTVSYAMIFLFGSVLITVEIPQLFGEKFHFNTQQLGLQFLAMIIGSVIGEQIGGYTSDRWMNRKRNRCPPGSTVDPEHRLWLNYFGFALTIAGIIVFLVRLEQAPALHWNVTPLIGAAIASAGNQIVTTVSITYAVDCYREEAAGVGVFVMLVRQVWGFIGPFWFPPMFTNLGLYGSAGLATGLMVVVSVIPTIVLHWKGSAWRP